MADLRSDRRWSLVVSGLRICNLKLQNSRVIQELYATFTRTPKLVVQVWNQETNESVARVELDSCETSQVTKEMKWSGEIVLKIGQMTDRERYYVVFTLATKTKVSLGRHSIVTLASTKLNLGKVPRILADEGTWFAELLDLKGTSCGPKSRLGVQLALMPMTQEDSWFDLPDSPASSINPTSPASLDSVERQKQAAQDRCSAFETETESPAKIVNLLEEAWTAGTIGRSPSLAACPEGSPSQQADSRFGRAEEEKVTTSETQDLTIRIHLHKICNLHNFNLLSLTGNTSIYAILYHGGQWKKSKVMPKSSSPVFNDIFEFSVREPTSYITVAFVEEVHMPFSGMKERFRTSRFLGKVVIQPSCFPANKKCHLKMVILSSKLMLRASPYALISVCFNYESFWKLLDVYWAPIDARATRLQVMDTMPDELKALSTEDLMDLWSKKGDYSLTASISSARRTLRRAKNAKQEVDLVLDPFVKAYEFVNSWKQPLASILVLISYCRLWLTPAYVPSVLLLMLAGIPLYQYQSNIQYSILFKSKFVNYKTWRASDVAQVRKEEVGEDGSPVATPMSVEGGWHDHDRLIHNSGDLFVAEDEDISGQDTPTAGDGENRQSVRRRIRTVARISQEFSNNVAAISSDVEKALHLVFWTDPRLSTIFVSVCLSGAILLLLVPPNYVALLFGCYLMRPPQIRDMSKKGVLMNLWSRLPDNSDAF